VLVLLAGCARRDESPQPLTKPSAAPSAPSAPSPPAIPAPAASARCITPESVGAVRFEELVGEGGDEKAALAAAARELERVLEVPAGYLATVQSAGDLVLLELWHRSTFAPEHCGKLGNPGEKSRTMAYDPRLRRIVSTKIWQ
jgi:hypothetical protein